MRNIFKDYPIFHLDPAKLRSRDFFKNMLEYRENVFKKFHNAIKQSSEFVCPLCKKNSGKEFLRCKDYTLHECEYCGLVSPNIRFDMLGNEDVYDDDAYIKDTIREIVDTYEYRKKTYAPERLSYILKKIPELQKENIKLLDVGCGPGYFISHLKDEGIRYKGIELANFLVMMCQERGLNVEKIDLKNEKKEGYNVITLFDVIEHLSNPIEFFNQINEKLMRGGYVVAYTPHIHSVGYELMKEMQNTLLPFQHLCFFDQASLEYLAKSSGFIIHSIDYFGLDVMDYFYMKTYLDNYNYLEKLLDFIPLMQAIVDKQKISNHIRVIFKKI